MLSDAEVALVLRIEKISDVLAVDLHVAHLSSKLVPSATNKERKQTNGEQMRRMRTNTNIEYLINLLFFVARLF